MFPGNVYKGRREVSRLEPDFFYVEIFLDVFFIRHPVLILDIFPSFFENFLDIFECDVYSFRIETPEWKCRNHDIETLWKT